MELRDISGCTSCNSLTVFGTSFALVDSTLQARLGFACEASLWASDSSLVCKLPSSSLGLPFPSDAGAVVTVKGRTGTISSFLEYALPPVSSVDSTNIPTSGQTSMTASGSRFGSGLSFLLGIEVGIADWTVVARIGPTACGATDWVSDSAIVCKTALGFGQSIGFQITVGRKFGTMTVAVSYDQVFVHETVMQTIDDRGVIREEARSNAVLPTEADTWPISALLPKFLP